MANSGFDKVRDMRGDNDIDVGDGGSRITTGNGDDTITAGNGYDKIKAGGGDNQISVGDGGSSISTNGGDDTITAGDGFDRISAGNGDNDINVGDGGSFIKTGRGDDLIVSEDGYDFIFAGDGNNEIDAGDGGSFIKSGSGDDTITTGEGYDKIFAGNGNNEISTGDGGSFVQTGSGDDTIETGDGWDFVHAGNGNNQVDIGDGGGMVLTGSGDDNVTIGDQGFAFVHTGSGDDRVTVQIDEHLCFAKLLGGNGVDTLVLDISLDTYKNEYFQAEMAYFLEHRAPDGRPFYFRSLNIYVHSFEQVEVVVDGVSLDPIDLDVVASDDAVTLSEDDGAVLFGSVVDNDDVPNGLAQVTLIQGPVAGVLDLAPDGTFSFDPNDEFESLAEGEVAEVTFIYEVSDLDGDTSQATATISVIGDNDAPFLVAGTLDAAEDGATVDIDLASLGDDVDSDDDGSTLTYSVTSNPSEGSASISGTTLTFDPGADFQDLAVGETRDVTIQVTAEDAHGATAVNTVTVTVTGANDAPTLAAALASADEDGATVDVDLAALGADVDSDDDGSTLTYSVTGNPSEGSASISGRTLTFDPGADFQDLAVGETRDVTIQVTVEDAHGATAVNTVTVTVTGANDAPTLAAALASADEDGATVDVDLAALGADVDSDDDGATLTYSVTGNPSEGSASISGTTLTFDPGSDFQDLALGETRDVTIQVTAEDAHGATAVNTVTVTVTGANDAPTLAAALASADEDGATVDVDLAALGADVDSDDDGSTLTYSVTGNPSEGSASISGTTLTFDPGADFQDLALGETREVTIQVTAEDAHGATAVNTVTVTVTGTNDAPVSQAISGEVAEEGTSAEAFSLGIADSSTVPNAGLFYVLDYENQSLTEVFRAVGTIDTPLQAAQSLNVTNGMVLSLNGNNADWGAVAASIVDGVDTWADPNLFELSGYTGSMVADPRGFVLYRDSVSNATLTISVPDVETPDGPTTYEISAEIVSFQDNRVGNIDVGAVQFTSVPQPAPDTVTVSADFSDVDTTDTHSFSVDTSGTQGEVTNNGDGTFTYSANGAFEHLAEGETATDTFTYTVNDDSGAANDSATETATITITGINDVPTLAEGSIAANEDGGAVNFDLSGIGDDVDSDDDGSTLKYTITGQPGEGIASISGATLTFDPGSEFQDLGQGETRNVVIQITAEDAHGATALNDVTVTVTGVNDAPTLADGLASASEDGATVDVDLAALGADADSDDDGSTLTYSITGTPSEGSASISGTTLTFDPGSDFQDLALGETRDVTIQVTAEDAHGATAVNTVTVTVTGANDAPTLAAALASADEDGATVYVDLAALGADADSDDDGSTLAYSITGTPSEGSASISGTTLTFDPGSDFQDLALGETRDVAIQVTAEDAHGATAVNTVTVTVTGANDAPTLVAALASADEDGATVDVDLAALGADVDSDDDGATLTYSVTGQPSEGSASISGTTLTFDPGADFQDLALGETRDVTIQVTAEDAHGATAVNSVTATVTGGNDAPTLAAALASADEDGATVDVDLAALGADADSDDDGSTLAYAITGTPSEGSASISGTTLTFDPGSDFQDLALGETRDVTIQVTAEDAHGATAVNTVTVTVTGTNDAPVAQAISGEVAEEGTSAQAFSLGIADSSTVPNAGLFYVLDYENQSLTEVFRAVGTIDTPLQAAQSLNVTNGMVLSLNGNNADWGAVAASIVDGVDTWADPNLFELSGYTGSMVADPRGFVLYRDSVSNATLTISVPDVETPDGPTTYEISAEIVSFQDNRVGNIDVGAVQFTSVPQPAPDTVTVSADFSDVDTTDTHSFSVDTTGTQGEVTNNGDGTFTYSANGAFEHLAEGETATDTFTYTVTDDSGGTSTETATITITGQNDAPAAAAIDAGTVDEDGGSQTIDLLASATDIDGDNLSVSGISVVDDMGVALSFTDNGDGTISIDPIQYGEDLGQGESRVVTISYDIDDGKTTVSNTATMTVTGVTNNIAPTAQDTAVAPEGAGFVFDENPVVTSQQVSTTDQYQSGSYQYDANSDYNPSVIAIGDGGYAVAWREIDAEYSGTTRTSQTDQIAVQIYGADDQPVGAKMLFGEIDTSYSGDTDVDRAYEYNPRMVSMSDGGFAMTWEGDYRSYSGTTQTRYERDIYVQVFDATGSPTSSDPIKTSQTLSVTNGNTTAYDAFQDYQPEIAALADGGVAVTWRGTHYDAAGSTFVSGSREQNIYVRAYDADGTARGAEVSLGSDDRSRTGDDIDRHYDYNPRIAASEDGSFAVVWYGSYNTYSGTTYTGSSNDVFMQLFDADGAEQGSVIQVSQTVEYQSGSATNDAYNDNNPEIAALANGGYVVAWSGRHAEYSGTTQVSSEENIWVRVYDADGQPVSAELSLGEVDTSRSSDNLDRAYDYNPKVAATADGGFVVTWYGNHYAYSGTTAIEYTRDIFVQKFDENGDAVTSLQQISETGSRTTGNYQVYDSIADSDPQITDLLGGGFVVAWYSNQQTYNGSTFVESQQVVQAQRFDEDGNAVDDLITLGNVVQDAGGYDRSQDSQARVTALNDGGFAITWYNYTNYYTSSGSYTGNSTDVYVAAVHASGGGTELTDPVEVDVANLIDDADIPDGDQLTVTVATGSNGSTATVNGTVISLLPNAAYYAALGKDETEDETFTYTVTDLAGAQATATITLTVTGNNDKPEANAISGATDEDGPATTLTADFTDVDTNDTHTYSVNTADTLGVVTNNGDGTFDYDPNGAFEALAVGETTTDTFKYTVRDAAGKSSTATATVTITGENDAPTAQAAAISNGYVYAEVPETNQQQVSVTDPYTSGSRTYDANYDREQQAVAFGDGGYAVAWRQQDGTYSGSTQVSREDQIAVQIYDAEHNPVGGIQTFGEVDQSNIYDDLDRSYDYRPMLTEMPDGGFAMVWYGDYRSYTGTTTTRYERDIFVQVFDTNGDPTSTDPIQVSQTVHATNGSITQFDAFQDYNPTIGGLADGGVAITWQSQEYALSGTSVITTSRDQQIKVQTFDADGTARGSAVELGSDDRSYSGDNVDRHFEYEPRIATSDDGGFAVVWHGSYSNYSGTAYVGQSQDVFIQLFNADGTVQGATQQVSQTVDYTSGSSTQDAHRDYNPEVTALSDGGYAVVWYGEHSTYSGSTRTSSENNVYVRVYDGNGQAVNQAVSLGSVDTSYSTDTYDRHYDRAPNITATEDGGFVVVWQGDYNDYSGTTQTGYDSDIWVQRFDADGVQVGASEKLSQTVYRTSGSSEYDEFRDYNPVVTNLEGGGYVVVWQSNQRTFNGSTFVSSELLIQAQLFNAEGERVGDVIDFGTVAQDSSGNDRSSESSPEVAALSGGGFAITWYNNTQNYSSSGSYLGNSTDVMVGAVQPIGNGTLADGVVVDVADKIDDIDLAGGDTLTVTVDAVGSNGSTATVNGTEITISPNLTLYAPLAKGETAEETFTYTVTDASGAQASATLTFTARGENDAPVVESVTYSALDSGTIAFSDVDNGDTHTVAATDATITGDASALAGIDVFDFIAFDAVDQAGDTVDWTINVPSAAQSAVAAALADGETLTIDYTVGVSDEEEDLAQTTVSITLDGDGFLI